MSKRTAGLFTRDTALCPCRWLQCIPCLTQRSLAQPPWAQVCRNLSCTSCLLVPCPLFCPSGSQSSSDQDNLPLLIPPRISLSSHFLHFQATGMCAVFPLLSPRFPLALCCGASFPRPLEAALKSVPRGLPWWFCDEESAFYRRGHQFNPSSRKIPHAMEQLSPWATITEPMLYNKKNHPNDKPSTTTRESPPLTATRESLSTATKTLCSQK